MIQLIACIGKNGEIGKNGDMPWKRDLPEDLKHFKKTTTGFPVIMGRKTFESIKKSMGGPLPDRLNVVLTRNEKYHSEGCEVYHTVDEALYQLFEEEGNVIFVAGGAEIYEKFMPLADRLYLTVIDEAFEADTYFPAYKEEEWEVVKEKKMKKDEKNKYNHKYVILKRKKSA